MIEWLKVIAVVVALGLLTLRGCSFGLENSRAPDPHYTTER